MGIYDYSSNKPNSSEFTPSREDIQAYQEALVNAISQFQSERAEAEAMFEEVRSQQENYKTQIALQDQKISDLNMLVIKLLSKTEV